MSSDTAALDDLITERANELIGPNRVTTGAILICESMTEEGAGLRYIPSDNLTPWQIVGLLRSVLQRVEAEDLAGWYPDEDEDD